MVIIFKIFFKFKRTITQYKIENDPEASLLILGIVVLVASHVFYIAYSFEYYSLLFVGLGMASLKNKNISIDEK
jgi:hypothetical protein